MGTGRYQRLVDVPPTPMSVCCGLARWLHTWSTPPGVGAEKPVLYDPMCGVGTLLLGVRETLGDTCARANAGAEFASRGILGDSSSAV